MSADDSNSPELFRVAEAARRAGINSGQLQYYLMTRLVQPTAYSSGRQRLFDERAVKRIRMIHLLNQSGYTLRDIRQIFIERPGRS